MIVSISFQIFENWDFNSQDDDDIEIVDSESEKEMEDELEEDPLLDDIILSYPIDISSEKPNDRFHQDVFLKNTSYLNIIVPPPELV